MSKSDVFENDLLRLIFNAVPIPNLADDAAVGPLTDLYVAWHTADPGEAGNQSTSEATYTGYARTAVPRDAANWVVTGNSVSPVNDIPAPAATAGNETLTHFSIGTVATGTGKVFYSGTVAPTVAVSAGVTPILTAGTTITED